MDDYKKLIIEMLDHATQKQLRLIYIHINFSMVSFLFVQPLV